MKFSFYFFTLILSVFGFQLNASNFEKPIVVVIPSYKNEIWYKQNLDSVFNQRYSNYRVIYVDDCSPLTNGVSLASSVESYAKQRNQQHRVMVFRNEFRQLALKNLYKAILSCKDEEIVAIVDGDDMLADPNVLSKLNSLYSKEDIWITYGDFKFLSDEGRQTWTEPFPQHIIAGNEFREWPDGLTHLRTFYAWLFKQIKIEDLFYEGDFFKMTYDVAIFEPMIEMAQYRHLCIKENLYIYNDLNSINDYKVNVNLQHHLNKVIRQKLKYMPLQKSRCGEVDTLKNQGKLTSDLLIFSCNNPSRLQFLLKSIDDKLRGIKAINVIYKADENYVNDYNAIMSGLPNVNFVKYSDLSQSFSSVVVECLNQAASDYVILTSDKVFINEPIDISECIYKLEQTHAYGFYLSLSKKHFDDAMTKAGISLQSLDVYDSLQICPIPVQISLSDSDKLYAWQFRNFYNKDFGKFWGFSLFRKEDLSNLIKLQNVSNPEELEKLWGNALSHEKVGLLYHLAKVTISM